MKYLLILISLSFSLTLFAQAEDENFYLADGKMSWQKSYPTEKTKEEIITFFENSKIFKVVKIENNQIVGILKPHAVDPNKTGVAGVPPIINKTDFKGDVVIQYRVKEKDYVVSFTSLVFVGNGEVLAKNEEQAFEEQFVSKSSGKYRPGFLVKPKTVYNTTFIPIFEIK
jgi:hypothetical protein